jgi:hypothetical protein
MVWAKVPRSLCAADEAGEGKQEVPWAAILWMIYPETSKWSSTISGMPTNAPKSVLPAEPFQVFVCYAHADNQASNPEKRWLDRLLEFLHPLERQGSISCWSDRKLNIGDQWHENIQARLDRSKAVILLVSPAFLRSQYVSTNELPLIVSRALSRRMLVLPILLSPSLFERAEYKYPDSKVGPHTFRLADLQAANSPDKTMVDLNEGDQNRVFLQVAEQLYKLLPAEAPEGSVAKAIVTNGPLEPTLVARFQEANGKIVEISYEDVELPSLGMNLWVENAPEETRSVSFEIDDLSFTDRIWTLKRNNEVREFLTDDVNSWGNADIWARGKLADKSTWRIKSSLFDALIRHYGTGRQCRSIAKALKQIKEN